MLQKNSPQSRRFQALLEIVPLPDQLLAELCDKIERHALDVAQGVLGEPRLRDTRNYVV
jgi:hypothetical protein